MLLSQTVMINWNSRNKNRFVSLGYEFTKMKDSFEVDVNDLSSGSLATVDVKCDYCGKLYQKPWHRYLLENSESEIHKDCCTNCKKLKIMESVQLKYGVTSVLSLDDIKERIEETNLKRYGAKNPFQSQAIKDKIVQTNLEKYGETSPMKNRDIISKTSKTCMEKYGVPFFICTQRLKGELHPKWKGGVAYHRVERSTSEYIEWRTSVFHRDRYTCQCCGIRNGDGRVAKLNAHHIDNWKDFPESRYIKENGITLCEECHIEFHKMYGKKLNNRKQLENFFIKHGKKICWTDGKATIRDAG